MNISPARRRLFPVLLSVLIPVATNASAPLFTAEEIVLSGGISIQVPGYSVPSFIDWDEDGLEDLIVGEGGGGVVDGKVRVYINTGSTGSPAFSGYFYVQSLGSDLVRAGGG